MITDEKIAKAEQELNKAKKKLADAKRKAQKERRNEEDSRKYMMGGLVAKYFKEEMELYFMDFLKRGNHTNCGLCYEAERVNICDLLLIEQVCKSIAKCLCFIGH